MIESAFVSRLVRAAALAAAICGVSTAGPARADFEIEEPEVEQGEIELEYRGAYFWGRPALAMTPPAVMSDNNDDDDDGGAAERESDEGPPRLENEVVRHGHEFEFKAGVTDRWALEIEAEFEEERGEDGGYNAFKLTEVGLASKIELIPLDDGENGVGATLFVGYEKSVVSSENEKGLWVGPLLKGTRGPVSATVNLYAVNVFDVSEIELEDGELKEKRTPDHWNFDYRWQLKYQMNDALAFGVEGFGNVQDIGGDVFGSDPEKHRVGPVLYLTRAKPGAPSMKDDEGNDDDEGARLNMAFGVLFGLNDDTSDVALKWDLELEF